MSVSLNKVLALLGLAVAIASAVLSVPLWVAVVLVALAILV